MAPDDRDILTRLLAQELAPGSGGEASAPLLARLGADPDVKIDGIPVAILAVICKRPELLKALAQAGADLDARDPRGDTALSMAVATRQTRAVAALLEMGANVDQPGSRHPLASACSDASGSDASGSDDIGLILLRAGAKPRVADHTGEPAICLSASRSTDVLTRELIAHGADVEVRDSQGRTPLLRALMGRSGGALANVVALLEAGADPTAKSKNGMAPLWTAIAYLHAPERALFDALLGAGASLWERTAKGSVLALGLEKFVRDPELLGYLQARARQESDLAALRAAVGPAPALPSRPRL